MDKPVNDLKHLNNNAILQMDMVNGATTNGLGGPGGGPGGHNNATNGVSNGDLGDEDKTKENILESLRKAAKNNSASKLKLTPDQWKGIPTNRSVIKHGLAFLFCKSQKDQKWLGQFQLTWPISIDNTAAFY